MFNKIAFTTYVKSMLVASYSKLKSQAPPDNAAASRLDAIVRTAENISDGYWAKIAPLYEPFAPKLQLAVRDLNKAIIEGQSVPDFDTYIAALVEKITN